MIKSFKDRKTEKIYNRESVKGIPPEVQKVGRRKLEVLGAATSLEDLRRIPGNKLEELRHDRKGQHSIMVNDLYRVCFIFNNGDAYDVEIVNYH